MTVNVYQGFLQDPEKGRLFFLGGPFPVRRQIQFNREAASFSEAFRVPGQRLKQAFFVEKVGMQ
jgi:hypothetical protein